MLVEYGFKYAAQIERGLEVAIVEQGPAAQGRPVGNHLPAANCSAHEKGATACSMIGTARAIDGGRSAKLRDDENRGLRPQRPQFICQRFQRLVEAAQACAKNAFGAALIGMGIPAAGLDDSDLGTAVAAH